MENNDGIVAITSIPFINKNKIEKNKSNGIMLIKDARPKITNNLIQENDGIGLFIRDKSNGEIHDNNVKILL
jgi:F-box protein 11